MSTCILDAANSEYVRHENYLRTSLQLQEVIIYVEGWDDIDFWRECVSPYIHKRKFTIDILRDPDGKFIEGKRNLLSNIPITSLGPNMLIAVDADYDWIIEDYKPSSTTPSLSRVIRNNPYILHTYLYSIESYKCHALCLPGIITKSTGITLSTECVDYMSEYSKAVADLFLIHLVSVDLVDGIYTLSSFITDVDHIKLDFSSLSLKQSSLDYLNKRRKNLSSYVLRHQNEIEFYKNKLLDLGFNEEKYYLLFKGHCVANTMVRSRFLGLIQKLRINKQKQIYELANLDITQGCQQMAHYCKITGIEESNNLNSINKRLIQLINDCCNVQNVVEGYPHIKEDLDRLFS